MKTTKVAKMGGRTKSGVLDSTSQNKVLKKPKILLYDIETSPLISYTWGIWEQDVIQVKEDWHILSVAYKWLGEKKTHVISLPDFPLYKKDKNSDERLVECLWDLFNEADIIIGHNSDAFDNKKSMSRFVQYHLRPPTPYKVVDTKKIAKRYFRFDSNKLDSLGQYLGLGRKLKTGGFDLWLGCMKGDKASWKLMCKYNIQDVILLEKVYLALLPYITNHPNTNLLQGTTHNCPNCGSQKMQKRGTYTTRVSFSQRYQCQECGSWSQGESMIR